MNSLQYHKDWIFIFDLIWIFIFDLISQNTIVIINNKGYFMQRRTFIKYNALATLGFIPLFANPHDHHNHHTMSSNTNEEHLNTSFITLEDEKLALFEETYFPQHNIHKPLALLSNTSNKKGFFHAKLEIKETKVELIKGKKTRCYTYKDMHAKTQSMVAPKIEVYENDVVKIEVKNSLNEPTTIHWHGLPIPPSQDGNPMDIIPANGYRTYEFKLPNDCAGTYWYHPHPHNTTAQQVYMGLAGAFVVKSHSNPLKEFVESDWFITDLRLDSNAQIPANALSDWLDGREGEFVLINGEYKPQITMDSMQRIRIYNACSARYLNLELQGSSFILVGTDGGLIEKPIERKQLLISPASRVEIFIKNVKKGDFKLISHFYDRDKMIPKNEPKILELANIKLNAEYNESKLPKSLRLLPKLQPPTQQIEITMSEDHSKMHNLSTQNKEELKKNLATMFLINNKVFDMNRIDFHVKMGAIYDIVVTNKSHMDHPFHIHGTQFEVIEKKVGTTNEKIEFRALQDSINVRPNESIRLRMKQSFKGIYMFHCHILEHESLGMMGNLSVM